MNIQNTFIISFLEDVHHVLRELWVILTLLRKSKLKKTVLSSNSFFDCHKLNPIQDGRGDKKAPPTSFSPVISKNVRTSPQNLLTFSFNSSSGLVSVPNYWTLSKTTPQKKRFFWSNPYKIEIMITSLIEMLE